MNRRGFLGALLALPAAIKAAISSPAALPTPLLPDDVLYAVSQATKIPLAYLDPSRSPVVWAVVTDVVLPGDLLTANDDGTLRTVRSESESPIGIALDRASGEGARVRVEVL